MPRYDNNSNNSKRKGDDGDDDILVIPEAWTEPRCHVCTSKYRRAVDRLIAMGTNFSEISRIFGGEIDRRSISSHAKKHLGYEEAAVRTIIERQAAEAEENAEEGVSGHVLRRVYLETAVQKAMQVLLSGEVVVEPKDAISVIEALERSDRNTEGVQLDEIKMQFNAFLQAIKEISSIKGDANLGNEIMMRAREIVTSQKVDVPRLSP